MLDLLRRRVLPFAVWCLVMGTAAWLWRDLHAGSALGYVEGIAYNVTSQEPGRIASLAVTPGQHVRTGDIIATLDGSAIDAELHTLEGERLRVEAELLAAASQSKLDVGETTRDIEEAVESAEIARQEARAQRSIGAAELAALEAQIEDERELVDKRMGDRRALAELAVTQAALRKQIQVADGLIRQLDASAAAARARRGGVPVDAAIFATAPLRAELEVIRGMKELVVVRKAGLTLRAPGPGEVHTIFLQPGELVVEGSIVMTITGPAELGGTGPAVVFVCASEAQSAPVRVGEAVRLAPPRGGSAVLSGHVDRLAPAVALLPERCWRDARQPSWGRGIYITVDDGVTLLPGQSFAIEFTGEISPRATQRSVAPVVAPAISPDSIPVSTANVGHERPVEVVVPNVLLAASRFEPSGLLWSAARSRYLIVSDDTGHEDLNEHAPWLFAMDATGTADAAPIRVAGVEKWSDLEAIAAAPDGGVYVLASQSFSKKGKRSKPRQVFARIAVGTTTANVSASVSLAQQLDDSDGATLAALGLADTSALDIEGMTATRDGGLLLGLKAPVGRDGAPIWHLANPDALLAGGSVTDAGLTLWAHVQLQVRVAGEEVPGGIAELLELPDGKLLVATTATGDEPSTQDGGLFVVDSRDATPSRVREFPGLKPEGLARNAAGDAIVIVFDTGASTPRWMELRWPPR